MGAKGRGVKARASAAGDGGKWKEVFIMVPFPEMTDTHRSEIPQNGIWQFDIR